MYCSDLATAGGLVSPLFSAGSVHNINIDIMHEIRVRFSRKHEKRVIPCHTRYTAYHRPGAYTGTSKNTNNTNHTPDRTKHSEGPHIRCVCVPLGTNTNKGKRDDLFVMHNKKAHQEF